MWKECSIAAFISSLFLSLICCLYYNVWMYEIDKTGEVNMTLLVLFYMLLLLVVSASLILIIHNAFAVSMNGRIHQLGIFASIGATPRQILGSLLKSALQLCCLPILAGDLLGILLSVAMIELINHIAEGLPGRQEAVWQYHPLVLTLTLLVSFITMLISAWLPARKLSKMTPLQAIRNSDELILKRKRHSPILNLVFGVEGELAGNALKAQKKALRTSALSLTFSCLAFSVMLCFFTLTGISTNHTYFERYQDAWDVMVTLKDTVMEEGTLKEELGSLQGVENCVIYQKASAVGLVPKEDISEELMEIGGLNALAPDTLFAEEQAYIVNVPIVIMDDKAFAEYCRKIGIVPGEGSIILNRIWDSTNSNFRYKKYIPFVKENANTITLKNSIEYESEVTLPILAYTQKTPVLREEYENDSLVQFLPFSLWKKVSATLNRLGKDTYIRVLGKDGVTLSELNLLQSEMTERISATYIIEIENRLQEKVTDDDMRTGAMAIFGGFCALLAVIGIANVFTNTLGFLWQRKREFAKYMSIGMTSSQMKKMFVIEAFVVVGKPILVTLVSTIIIVTFMIKVSYLDPMEFWQKAPIVPLFLFLLAIILFVAAAYYIGGKRILRADLIETLKNDL